MQIEQSLWTSEGGWVGTPPGKLNSAQLVMVFGGRRLFEESCLLACIRQAYPRAFLTGCSTAGEICGTLVYDDSMVVRTITTLSERKGANGQLA